MSEPNIDEIVYTIFKDVLKVTEITNETSFYDLGGDSVLSGIITGKINKSLDLDIGLSVIMRIDNIGDIINEIKKELDN